MKYLVCILIKILFAFEANGSTMNLENNYESALCSAVSSIIELGVLASPLSIQLISVTFVNCVRPNQSTFLINFCTNETSAITQSTLVIAETEEDVMNMNHACMNHNGHHLIVIQKYSSTNLRKSVNLLWKKLLINVSFLMIGDSHILLQTFIPFNENKCYDTVLKTINKFNDETRNWTTLQFFPDKLGNFHRCTLKVTTHKNIVPYIVREEYENGKRILKGRVIKMFDALADSLNFTTDLDYQPEISAWEICIQKVANKEADLFIGNLFLDLPRTEYLDFTIPIFFEFLKFVVPPGRSFTQIENFARAFDMLTWFLILCVFLLIAFVVVIITFRSTEVKIYAFGIDYRSAFMDFIAAILGITRVSMPNMNFPRLIIIKFLLFCFVMRTLYQGSLFNFLQSGGKVKEAQSIDEMISREYTFYMLKLYDNYFNVSQHQHVSKTLVDISDFDEVLENISNTNFKGTLMHTASVIIYKNGLKDRKFTNLFCKEYLMNIAMVAYLPKNFYLTEVVNKKIGIFHSAGLIDAWDRKSKIVSQSSTDVIQSRKPISFNELKGVFIIYMIGCAASMLSFVTEIVFRFLKNKLAMLSRKLY